MVELSREIQRYRILRNRLLTTYRQKAIEAALRHVDMAGIAPEFEDKANYHARQNALSWRFEPVATTEIEARLVSYGFRGARSSSCSRACSMLRRRNDCCSSGRSRGIAFWPNVRRHASDETSLPSRDGLLEDNVRLIGSLRGMDRDLV